LLIADSRRGKLKQASPFLFSGGNLLDRRKSLCYTFLIKKKRVKKCASKLFFKSQKKKQAHVREGFGFLDAKDGLLTGSGQDFCALVRLFVMSVCLCV